MSLKTIAPYREDALGGGRKFYPGVRKAKPSKYAAKHAADPAAARLQSYNAPVSKKKRPAEGGAGGGGGGEGGGGAGAPGGKKPRPEGGAAPGPRGAASGSGGAPSQALTKNQRKNAARRSKKRGAAAGQGSGGP